MLFEEIKGLRREGRSDGGMKAQQQRNPFWLGARGFFGFGFCFFSFVVAFSCLMHAHPTF